ncbi:substrate-binding domain-containing protein [Microbacterium sp. NPDC055903]
MSRGKGPGGGGRRRPPSAASAKRSQKGGTGAAKAAKATRTPKKPAAAKVVFDAPAPAEEEPRTFRLGIFEGATPGKWVDIWKRRMPHVPLELVRTDDPDAEVVDHLDARLARLPIDEAGLHVIRLYEELPVVVAPVESHLLAADELDPADLAGEVLLSSRQDVIDGLELPGTTAPAFGVLPTTADMIATVATGVGIAVVPMSIARLHHRKDLDHRVLRGAPLSAVAFVWPRERTTADVETFVGIIRGRTANSSR